MSAFVQMPKLDLCRAFPSDVPSEELTAYAAGMRTAWQADGVLHAEVAVDLRAWSEPVVALRAIAAGLAEPDDERPWSHAIHLVVATAAEPWLEWVEDAEVTTVRGLLAPDGADLPALAPLWREATARGWLRLVHAESQLQLKGAFSLGFDRLLGGSGLLREPALLAHLRIHRVAVQLSPSAQVATGAVASSAQHPLRRLAEAGVPTVVGSAWPLAVAPSLSVELEHIARHHHWRLEDLRSLMARNAEAAALAPEKRFGVARLVESWRHRPHAAPAAKGDGWSL